jgi:hypothetical protein
MQLSFTPSSNESLYQNKILPDAVNARMKPKKKFGAIGGGYALVPL